MAITSQTINRPIFCLLSFLNKKNEVFSSVHWYRGLENGLGQITPVWKDCKWDCYVHLANIRVMMILGNVIWASSSPELEKQFRLQARRTRAPIPTPAIPLTQLQHDTASAGIPPNLASENGTWIHHWTVGSPVGFRGSHHKPGVGWGGRDLRGKEVKLRTQR